VVHQVLGTHQGARESSTNVDQVFAHRLELEHLVERGRSIHLGRGGPDQFSDVSHRFVGHVTVLLLSEVQQGNGRGTRAGITPDDFFGEAHVFVGQASHQRSTSPSTGSTEEMTATASATKPPRIMCGSACTLTKDGARTCMRYGVGEPSLAI